MSLLEHEDIPLEKHRGVQFIRVEKGRGIARVGSRRCQLKEGTALLIPENTRHYIKASRGGLKLYTLYCPPEHPRGLRQKRQPIND